MEKRWSKLLSAAAALAALGCGRSATLEDCRRIVERVTTLEVRERMPTSSPEQVEREVQRELLIHEDTMQQHCVGNRITDSIMNCVREAKTSDEIFEECF